MTPGARVAAAIAILDRVADGEPAERALTNWARASRYAGSKDRAAVRDHVFDVLRRWRSTAVSGGADTGRGRMLGLLRQLSIDPEGLYSGEGHAPPPLTAAERSSGAEPTGFDAWDLQDWVAEAFEKSLAEPQRVAAAMRQRAPVFLRVNALKTDRTTAVTALAEDGIVAVPAMVSETALDVVEGARKVSNSRAYRDGLVELQDAASQAVVDCIPLVHGQRILDYCAGGGGKALAMAARVKGSVMAHDADPKRMRDLPERAARAGAKIEIVAKPEGQFDVILCDVPCSGSGAWRRAPEGKWRLRRDDLDALLKVQARILGDVAPQVAAGGVLAYATCSLLAEENQAQIERFMARHGGWTEETARQFLPSDQGDGLFVSVLRRNS